MDKAKTHQIDYFQHISPYATIISHSTCIQCSSVYRTVRTQLIQPDAKDRSIICREGLSTLLKQKRIRNLYNNTYPEINKLIRKNPHIDSIEKFRSFCVYHHMYYLYAVLIRIIEKIQ